MKLKVLSLSDVEQVRQWRNEQLDSLRTSFPLTKEQQERFYADVVCNRQANARYWGVWEDIADKFIGMIGIESIELENRRGEISFITDPEYSSNELNKKVLVLMLDKGFYSLNLDNIWGECYECNNSYDFWIEMIKDFNGTSSKMENTKFFNGKYHNSLYFNFNKGSYAKGEACIGETPQNKRII